jgi:hypothetical protein
MRRRDLPKCGLWLLQRLGRGYHIESFIGDLVEQCAQGRSGWWAWREIVMAIVFAQARRWRLPALHRRARIFFWWGLTEASVILSLVLLADQSRNSHTFRDMLAPRFIAILAILVCIAGIGLKSLISLYRRQREHAAVHHLVAIFAFMTLSIGTLTWAATARHARGPSIQRENAIVIGAATRRLPLR